MRERSRQFSRRTILLLALGGCGCAVPGAKQPEGAQVMRVDPTSPSIIVRAHAIVLVRVVSSAPGPWTSPPDGFPTRRVTLDVTVEEVLKGRIREQPGATVSAVVVQYQNPSKWEIPLPGVWTDQPIEPGTRLAIFAGSDRDDLASLLPEPACIGVAPADEAAEGVRLAARAERQPLRLDELLAAAGAAAARLDILFVQYLETRLSEPAMAQREAFEALLALLEHRALPRAPRTALVSSVIAAVSAQPIYSASHLDRLALGLFRLAAATAEADLRDNLLTTLLPNVLGLTGGTPRPADDVFRDQPSERDRARSLLRQVEGEFDVMRLLAWIDR